ISASGRERAEGEPRLGGADVQRRGSPAEPHQPVLDAAAPRAAGRARPRPRRLRGGAAPRAPPGGPVLDVALRTNAAIRRASGAAVTPCGDGPTKRLCPAMNGRWNRTHGGRALTMRKSIARRDFVTKTYWVVLVDVLG